MWINGVRQETVPALDRSFQYGDGTFTTIQTRDGQLMHWQLHRQRLEACLKLLAITEPDWSWLESHLNQIALGDSYAGLKVLISRGSGGHGYLPPETQSAVLMTRQLRYPQHYPALQNEGIRLGVSRVRLGHNPLLAGHKHNNRLEQVLVRQDLAKQGYDDGIALDICGRVIETSCANLYWTHGKTLYTPQLDKAGVAGIMRRLIISTAPDLGYRVVEGEFGLEPVTDAQEVFISNALLGAAPVTEVDGQRFAIGPLCRALQERL